MSDYSSLEDAEQAREMENKDKSSSDMVKNTQQLCTTSYSLWN